jgi:hypothetical protein
VPNSGVLEHSRCRTVYGYVIDRTARRNVSICGGQSSFDQREKTDDAPTKTVYLSTSNQLQISVKDGVENKFLIRVEGQLTIIKVC